MSIEKLRSLSFKKWAEDSNRNFAWLVDSDKVVKTLGEVQNKIKIQYYFLVTKFLT